MKRFKSLFSGREDWEGLVGFLLDRISGSDTADPRSGPRPGFRLRSAMGVCRSGKTPADTSTFSPGSWNRSPNRLPVSEAARALAEGDAGRFLPSALEEVKAALKVDYTTEFDIS